MISQRNIKILKGIKKGDVITAEYVTAIAEAINANTRAIATPRQLDDGDEIGVSGQTSVGDEVFDSVSGTETTVTITDSNGDTHDIERVDTIKFQEQGSGRFLTLNITYPL